MAGTATASFGASTAGAGVSFGTSAARAVVVLVGATEEMAAGAGAAKDVLARCGRGVRSGSENLCGKADKGITYAQLQLVVRPQV